MNVKVMPGALRDLITMEVSAIANTEALSSEVLLAEVEDEETGENIQVRLFVTRDEDEQIEGSGDWPTGVEIEQ